MKKILLLIVTASILSCGTTSKLSNDDLNLFSGKWQISCYSSISEPEYKECTITENTHQFVINENTGKSQIEYLRAWDGFKEYANIKISKTKNEFILTFLDRIEPQIGKIVQLDNKELVIHFESENKAVYWRKIQKHLGYSKTYLNFPKKEKRIEVMPEPEPFNINDHIEIIPEVGKKLLLHSLGLEEFPKEVFEIDSLVVLELSFNNINIIPPEIGNLEALEELYITNNKITTFPESMRKLINLKILKIEDNDLSKFPEVICELKNLGVLSIISTEIEEIPECIGNLDKLRTIDARSNNITEIPAYLPSCINLKSLLFSNNLISKLPSNLEKFKSIEYFDLDYNPLLDEERIRIKKVLGENGIHLNLIRPLTDLIGRWEVIKFTEHSKKLEEDENIVRRDLALTTSYNFNNGANKTGTRVDKNRAINFAWHTRGSFVFFEWGGVEEYAKLNYINKDTLELTDVYHKNKKGEYIGLGTLLLEKQ